MKKVFPLFAAFLTAAALSCLALADPPQDADLHHEMQTIRAQLVRQEAQLQAQEQEIRRLRGDQEQIWLDERRAEEIRQIVQEVLADTESRASLLQEGMYAGHDGSRFYLASADGGFLMYLKGYLQIRYVANFRNAADDSFGTSDDAESGFQMRRAKLQFGGHISSPRITYFLQLTGNRDTGTVELEDAFVGYEFGDAMTLRAGRLKAGFLLEEEDVGATRQLAVERSLVNAIFTVHYVEGVELLVTPTPWLRVHASLNDGLRSGDQGGIGNDFQNDQSDFALTGRAELKLAGDWKQVSDFVAWSGEDTLMFVGGGLHYEVEETGDSQATSPGVDDFLIYTIDGQFKCRGFTAFAAFVGRHINATDGAATGDLNDLGFVAQAGYMVIPDTLVPFVRYEWIGPDDERDLNDMNLITMGANYFFRKHATKFTIDLVWALDELNTFAFTSTPSGTPSATSRAGLGLLPDSPGSDNQIVLRTQFQVQF